MLQCEPLLFHKCLTLDYFTFWAIVVLQMFNTACVTLSVWPVQRRNEDRHAGRKVTNIILKNNVCVERPLTDGFTPNLVNMLVSLILSNVRSFIVITYEVSVLWGVKVCVLPLGSQVILTLCYAPPCSRWYIRTGIFVWPPTHLKILHSIGIRVRP